MLNPFEVFCEISDWIFYTFYTVAEDFDVKYFCHICADFMVFLNIDVYAIRLFSENIKKSQVVKLKKYFKMCL